MKWILVLAIYAAPSNAVDWNGPWTFGMNHAVDSAFKSESACQAGAKQLIKKMHEGMLAPIRYQCVAFPGGLPKNASR